MGNVCRLAMLVVFLGLSACSSEQDLRPSNTTQPSTAQPNVTLLEPSFSIPDLGRERQVRVYLPPGYAGDTRRYPVIYMHDGQNLFDQASSYAGEWKVDETLNHLSDKMDQRYIVVGIDNGGEKRANELSPWPNKDHGAAEGEAYVRFIVEQVKPHIDRSFRTKRGASDTAMIGSSMGGLISHYALHEYPDVFGKGAIFSPSYWFSDQIYTYTAENPLPRQSRLYFLAGTGEGDGMVDNMQAMARQLVAQGHPSANLFSRVVEGGEHNEAFWASEFAEAVLWLFATESDESRSTGVNSAD